MIGPLVEKVQTLSRDMNSGRGMMAMGMLGQRGGAGGTDRRRGGAPAGTTEEPPSELRRAQEALQAALADETSTPALIKDRLTAYRKAREKARLDLAKAQEELRQVLTVRQEAQLVLMGLLD